MTETATPAPPAAAGPSAREWSLPRRIAFRFCFLFLISIFLPLPFGVLPKTELLADAYQGAWQKITPWVGEHVLALAEPVLIAETGSGDTASNWIRFLVSLVGSFAIAVVWSLADRRRAVHPWWEEGLRIYVRYGLAITMFTYGFAKVFPGQFPAVAYEQLVSPLGHFSPMGLLWAFMGASAGYTAFGGATEVLAGLFLLFRRTATLGALICAGVMTNVLALNLFYDVPVKLYSAELLLSALFLVGPDAGRLAALLLFNRPAPPRDLAMPTSSPRFLTGARLAKATFLAIYFGFFQFHPRFTLGPTPKPPLYGIWEVETFSLDGQEQPAIQTESGRWRRVMFSEWRRFTVQKVNDATLRYTVKEVNPQQGTLELVGRSPEDRRVLTYRQEANTLEIAGELENHQVAARLRQVADPRFELTSRGFHWVTEFPYNRF